MALPSGLTPEEEAAWARLASSVEPLAGRKIPKIPVAVAAKVATPKKLVKRRVVSPPKKVVPAAQPTPRMARRIGHNHLDSTWDRKLKTGAIAPDYTLDLHDHYVDAAHDRLDSGMMQARGMGARLVLIITGRPRPVEAADRGSKRGVIRAKILDWLAVGDHAESIAAIRKAHRRHGGEGALYIVLKRSR